MIEFLRSLTTFWRSGSSPAEAALSPMAKVPAGLVRLPDGSRKMVLGFALDVRPVSNADWLLFMQATRPRGKAFAPRDGAPPWMFRAGWEQPEQPVVGVTQAEAEAFARWAKKSLPSEAQWQRAAGATLYPWGDKPPTGGHAVYGRRPGKGRLPATPEAGLRPLGVGPYGHLDLVGNVWERLQGSIARGGFWGATDPRSDLRLVLGIEERSAGVGLRCCR